NRWSCANDLNAPAVISSRKYVGRSNAVILDVSRWQTPRWRASQVTDSPSSIRPLVRPATAFSPVSSREREWKSMSRARSKQRSIGAAMDVSIQNVGIRRLRKVTTCLAQIALYGYDTGEIPVQ